MSALAPSRRPPPPERALRDHEKRLREIERAPLSDVRILTGISLADGVTATIPHGLGRAARFVSISAVRGAPSTTGRIEELRDGSVDRNRYVALQANGWTDTVTVDVLVL